MRGEAQVAEGGSLVVSTGSHTGRSPKDKFIVRDGSTESTIWWDNNRAMTRAHFQALKQDFLVHARNSNLFIQDLIAGADPLHELPARVICENAWHALFIQHLLIAPASGKAFTPRLTIIDLHSGLGPWGHGELICVESAGTPPYERARALWGDVASMADGSAAGAILEGDWLSGAHRLAPHAEVTGGALQIGDASTPGSQTIRVNSTAPVYNLVVNATNSPTAQLVTNGLTVKKDVTIAGGTLNANGLNMNVGGNWTNNGAFTAGAGTVTFNGATAQTIGGSVDTTFAYLTINNTAGVSLGRPALVNNQLTLTSGLLTLGGYNLTMGASVSAISGTFGDTRMIVAAGAGALCKQFAANGSYAYPIGAATGASEYLSLIHI